MSKVGAPVSWTPTVLGREKLDEHRWIYAVEAPFEMAWNLPDLIGATALVDGRSVEVRGTIPKFPRTVVGKGEVIELLVVAKRA